MGFIRYCFMLFFKSDEVRGFNDAYEYFQFGIDEQTKSKIETLIEKRNEAKKPECYHKHSGFLMFIYSDL